MRAGCRVSVVAAVALCWGSAAQAQEVLTVAALPGAVAFVLTGGGASNPGAVTLAATTVWTTLALSRDEVRVYAYFTSASDALTSTFGATTVAIPASRVQVSVNGGAMMALSQTVPFGAANAGRLLVTQSIGLLNRAAGLRADVLAFNIDLSGYALPAGTYTGVVRFRAQAVSVP